MLRKSTHLLGKALRETGQAVDRLGLTVSGVDSFNETFSRHRPLMNLYDKVRYLLFIIFLFYFICIYPSIASYYGSRQLGCT